MKKPRIKVKIGSGWATSKILTSDNLRPAALPQHVQNEMIRLFRSIHHAAGVSKA